MRKVSRLLSIVFLACSAVGLFSAVISNEIKDNQPESAEVKKSEASMSAPTTIYLGCASEWLSGGWSTTTSNTWIKWNGGSGYPSGFPSGTEYPLVGDKTHTALPSSMAVVRTSAETGYPIDLIEVQTFGCTNIVWSAKESSGWTSNYTVNIVPQQSEGGKLDTFIVTTYREGYNNQRGVWTYRDSNTTLGDGYDNLYFSSCYEWGKQYNWNNNMPGWPYLVIYKDKNQSMTSTSNILYQGGAVRRLSGGIPSFTSSSPTNQAHTNWKFINVPKSITSTYPNALIRMYHSFNAFENNANYGEFGSDLLSNWESGTNNFFGSTDAGRVGVQGFKYYEDESKAFLRGSFAEDLNINYTSYSGTYPSTSSLCGGNYLPTKETSFVRQSASVYTKTINVDVGDYFIYCAYDYLINVYEDNYCSSWDYGHLLRYDSSNISSITVVDENAVGEISKSSYIGSGSTVTLHPTTEDEDDIDVTPIKFLRAGVVEFKRTVDAYNDATLTLTYKTSGRSDTLSTSKPNKIVGSFSNEAFTLSFNYSKGRYESIILSLAADEEFQFKYNDESVSTYRDLFKDSATPTPTDYGYTLLSTTSTANYARILSSEGIAYYRVGWIPINTRGTGSPIEGVQFFIEKVDLSGAKVIDEENAVIAFGHRIALLETCSASTRSLSSNLKTVYDKTTYSGKVTTLKNITFNDYDYSEYLINGRSYTGLDRKASGATNAYAKYQWIQYEHNDGPYPTYSMSPSINNSPVYQENSNIIIIVVVSLSVLAIASLGIVNILVIKKRKHK